MTQNIVPEWQKITVMAEEGVLELMTWSPQSPDLNIIEHIWDYLDRKKVEHAPRNAEECFEVLQRIL